MGKSKRVAEMILQGLAKTKKCKTIFTMVRFGNVLGSSGSVIPLFKKQILSGGPITITHPNVTRYFMSIREASELVLQAGSMAIGGEVFILEMGKPVKIYDLAVKLIELHGKTIKNKENTNGNIEVEIIGLKDGEKIYEELLIENSSMKTDHKRIFKAQESFLDFSILENELSLLKKLIDQNKKHKVKEFLENLIYKKN